MPTRSVVVATRNAHKREEIAALLAGLPVRLLTLDEAGVAGELVEDGETFAENAAAKAEQAAAATGLWSLADDSGLEVHLLGGLPGVRSARFAGPGATDGDNNRLLLETLRARRIEGAKARFRCCAALRVPDGDPPLDRLRDAGFLPFPGGGRPAEVSPDGRTLTAEGHVDGVLLDAPRGRGGFGYDPLFLLPGMDRTMAEIPPAAKNGISHRAVAFRRMRDVLQALLAAAADAGEPRA